MKRLAIQLFGHLRTFQDTFQYFEKNVRTANQADGYEIDIFIHTWDQLNTNTITHYNQDGKQITELGLTSSIIEKIHHLYKPKKLLIEPQLKHDECLIPSKYGNKISIRGPFNVTYSMWKSSQLRKIYEQERRIIYDWVILTRPDVWFEHPFRIDEFLSVHQEFNIPLPNNAFFYLGQEYARGNKINDPQFIGGCDVIMFAKPENVDKATSFHLNFNNNMDIKNFLCPEYEYYKYWYKMNLIPMAFHYPQVIYIIRRKEDILVNRRKAFLKAIHTYLHHCNFKEN